MPITNSLTHTREFLDAEGVPQSVYALDSIIEGRWCVVPAEDGTWEIFRYAQGNKRFLTRASTEQAACDVLLGELGFGYLIPGIREE